MVFFVRPVSGQVAGLRRARFQAPAFAQKSYKAKPKKENPIKSKIVLLGKPHFETQGFQKTLPQGPREPKTAKVKYSTF